MYNMIEGLSLFKVWLKATESLDSSSICGLSNGLVNNPGIRQTLFCLGRIKAEIIDQLAFEPLSVAYRVQQLL